MGSPMNSTGLAGDTVVVPVSVGNELDGSQVKSTPKHNSHTVLKKGRPTLEDAETAPKASYRLQVKLTPEGREHIEELLARTKNVTTADLVRDALRVYDEITKEALVNKADILIRSRDTNEIERLRLW